jgi:hypothetical protein
MRAFRTAIPTTLQSLEDKQQYSCMISLAALDKLENGDQDHAKSILAREVTAEQLLNHVLPALAGVKPGLTIKVEHHDAFRPDERSASANSKSIRPPRPAG